MKMKNFQMLMMDQADQEVEKKIIHVEIKNQVQVSYFKKIIKYSLLKKNIYFT
jgi:hypothetical protein